MNRNTHGKTHKCKLGHSDFQPKKGRRNKMTALSSTRLINWPVKSFCDTCSSLEDRVILHFIIFLHEKFSSEIFLLLKGGTKSLECLVRANKM